MTMKNLTKESSTIRMHEENKTILNGLVGAETANEIFKNMFPPKINGYKKGKPLTVGQLKAIKKGIIVHVKYWNEDNRISVNDFLTMNESSSEEASTTDGYPFPLKGHTDEEEIIRFDNCGHSFSVSEAITK